MTPTLEALSPRICILGPSNSGKSTLACAIAAARGLEAIHLDRLHHRPFTDWVPRPEAEFVALHAAAIGGARWVIDGNYTRLIPERLARATGVVLLDAATAVSLVRYLRRCWWERGRRGGLEGGRDSVKWAMIRHIAGDTRANRRRYRALFDRVDRPRVLLDTPAALDRFYRANGLRR